MLGSGTNGGHHNSATIKAVIDAAESARVAAVAVGHCLKAVRASWLYQLASVPSITDITIAATWAEMWPCAISAIDRAVCPDEDSDISSHDVHHTLSPSYRFQLPFNLAASVVNVAISAADGVEFELVLLHRRDAPQTPRFACSLSGL